MRLLAVEPEPMLAQQLRRGLQKEAYAVDVARTAREAQGRIEGTEYDLVILDKTLPDGLGTDLVVRWRSNGFTAPVLILTGQDRLEDKLLSFRAGADDYLTKPFVLAELLVRVQNLLRRCVAPPMDLLCIGDLKLDRSYRTVRRAGHLVHLTAKEFALLEYLMLHANRPLNRLRIAEHVWDEAFDARSNVIDVVVGRLRRKLNRGDAPLPLHTIKGIGYMLSAWESRESMKEESIHE